ncbi:MAG: SagB/ThcOx family dehydrogenase [Spirochaetaceae bacterium]|nr:MAG: SagB/ThcOx family dehydrogenase [Spirochaetaceae bacterium]
MFVLTFVTAVSFPHGIRAKEEVVKLPEHDSTGSVTLEQALSERRSVRAFQDTPVDLETVSQLCWAAQGISDKARQLRTAPSAGALYGLDTYIAVGNAHGLDAGLYRYEPGGHELLLQEHGDVRQAIAEAALGQQWIADAPLVFLIVGVPERLAYPYRDRAERYTLLEAGHAAQNLALQAVARELATTVVGAFSDSDLRELLGVPSSHIPLYVIPVGVPAQ